MTDQEFRCERLADDMRLVVGKLLQAHELPSDSTRGSTDVTVPSTIGCALGRLHIGRFIDDDGTCSERSADSVSIDVIPVLIRLHDLYMKQRRRCGNQLEHVGRSVRALLDLRGLYRPVRAIFSTGFTVADVSTDGDSLFTNDTGSGSVGVSALLPTIAWETRRFANRFLSFSGGLGQRSLLAAWSRKPTNSAADAAGDKELVVRHQNGFFYDLFLDLHLLHSTRESMDAFVGVGQERVAKTTNVVDSVPEMLVDNRVGVWSSRIEAGVKYRAYRADLVDVEYGRASTSPVLEVAAGVRWHERFKPSNDLECLRYEYRKCIEGADRGSLELREYERLRMFWRMGIDLRQAIPPQDDQGGDGRAWSFMLVAEQELDWPNKAVPTSTRILIMGEKDVFRLFNE